MYSHANCDPLLLAGGAGEALGAPIMSLEALPRGVSCVAHRGRLYSRRFLLRATAITCSSFTLAALTGCGPTTSKRSSRVVVRAGTTVSAVPGLISSFNDVQTKVQVVPFSAKVGGEARSFLIEALPQYDVPRGGTMRFEPLDVALRLRNVDIPALIQGASGALQLAGRTYGLPVTQLPWAVRWRKDVFDAAAIKPPAADWTLDDFEAICTRLHSFAANGKPPQIATPLGPFLGEYGVPVSPSTAYWVPDAFEAPGLWSAFAIGFGGTLTKDGRFYLTAAATVDGLGRLVDLARRFGAPHVTDGAPTSGAQSAVLSGCPVGAGAYGMWFAPYVPPLHLSFGLPGLGRVDCARWQWARMPRFPVSPVIPTVVSGLGLARSVPTRKPGRVTTAPSTGTVARHVTAATSFLLWLYQSQAQTRLRSAGFVPVSASPAAQSPFWADASANVRALDDFGHFVDYTAGWPGVPPTDYVGQVLVQAVAAPAMLPKLLSDAELQLNNWLARKETPG